MDEWAAGKPAILRTAFCRMDMEMPFFPARAQQEQPFAAWDGNASLPYEGTKTLPIKKHKRW
jgi:hypothetical protein